jgi:hypothetical protein
MLDNLHLDIEKDKENAYDEEGKKSLKKDKITQITKPSLKTSKQGT